MNKGKSFTATLVVWLCLLTVAGNCFSQQNNDSDKVVRVFVLAGQSNMQGQAVVDLDDPQDYNGGKGTLKKLLASNAKRYGHLQNEDGTWVTRDDVWVRYRTKGTNKVGGLSVGFTSYDGKHHFGPELQFGHVIGNAIDDPVLLIKTAWGGKSLHKDFRPPRSGDTGPYFKQMIEEINQGLDSAAKEIPSFENHKLKLSGFVWFQGWNDMVDDSARKAYQKNLTHLIQDVREQLKTPELPFVVAGLGNNGRKANGKIKQIRKSQLAVTEHAVFNDNVAFAQTFTFARPNTESPNVGHGHHWYGNAESYFLIGRAMGKEMLTLLRREKPRRRVLIIGDSISMGYHATVKNLLASEARVIRPPENCAGTNRGVKKIANWVKLRGGKFDVIHFNFGLHDLKHVHPETGANSPKPEDPPQATIERYGRQLREIVAALKTTGAKLIFATTTPVPEGVRPFRDPQDPGRYNSVALKIMKENGIVVNDLFAFCESRDDLQRPKDVHFKPVGSKAMGEVVAAEIRKMLTEKETEK